MVPVQVGGGLKKKKNFLGFNKLPLLGSERQSD